MHIQAKKSLGQNFLIDQNIRDKIISSLDLKPTDTILEIGSGKGELTGLIGRKAGMVFALEIDSRLEKVLTESLSANKNIRVINQDILKLDLAGFIEENRIKGKIKVFGNIPYYISSPIIERLLGFRQYLSEIFITVQKEFSARVAASPGNKDYGSFSCFVQYYCRPKVLFHISRNCFKPSPKVDSSFLRLEIREAPAVAVKDENLFFKIVRTAFNQRRKTLRNSLRGLVSEDSLDRFFEESGIDIKVRAERLNLTDFALLARHSTIQQ